MGTEQKRLCEANIVYTKIRTGKAKFSDAANTREEIREAVERLNARDIVRDMQVIGGIEQVCITCARCGIENETRESSDNKSPRSAAVGAERLAAQVLEDKCQPFQPLKELGLKPNRDFHPMLSHIR